MTNQNGNGKQQDLVQTLWFQVSSEYPGASGKAVGEEVRNRGPQPTFPLQLSVLRVVSGKQSPR